MVNSFDFCVLIIIHFIYPGISAATPQNSMTTMISSSYESVDIGNCDRPTLRTSITPANISGHLVLSSASTEASTSLCNISLMAGGVASTSSLVTGCNTIGVLWWYRREHEMLYLKNPI